MMSAKRIAALSVAALLAATLLLSGCVKPTITPAAVTPTTTAPGATTTTESTQTSVEPTSATQINATGPITTPAAGSATRQALLDAARTKLATTSTFYVHQLYVQGDTALGDVEPLDGASLGRVFVAWEKISGVWKAVGAIRFGTASANAAATSRALPSFSPELISKINWNLAAKPVTTTSGSATSMKASLSTAAKAWAKTNMNGTGSPYNITSVKVAQDSKGAWWGVAVVQPSPSSNSSFDPLTVWAKYSGGNWTGKIQDPEPPAPSTYFPSAVVSKLGL
ncbi:MAG: hypothetical protein P4L93_10275 [Coriobacteriia bacterium]|nr:hypothetical protein [Coriobacteriia bacterium]